MAAVVVMVIVAMIAGHRLPIIRYNATRFMWCRSRNATRLTSMTGDATMITVTHRAITCRPRSRAITKHTNTRSAMTTALCNRRLAGMAAVTITATISSARSVTMHNGVESAEVMTGAMSVRVGSGSATDHYSLMRYEFGAPSS